MRTSVLDIPPAPQSLDEKRCSDKNMIQEASQRYTYIHCSTYMGVVHETPVPRLSEIAYNMYADESGQLTGGAEFHRVLI